MKIDFSEKITINRDTYEYLEKKDDELFILLFSLRLFYEEFVRMGKKASGHGKVLLVVCTKQTKVGVIHSEEVGGKRDAKWKKKRESEP